MSKLRRRRKLRPLPQAIDENAPRAALRGIAVFEALKGGLVLAAGFGLLSLLHKDIYEAADHLVRILHMRPEGHVSEGILRAAEKLTDVKLWAIAAGAVVYSTVRFVEAYGLWNCRVWAEWFALLSGSLYLPWETFELIAHPTPIRWVVFGTNLAIVLYMLYERVVASRPLRG